MTKEHIKKINEFFVKLILAIRIWKMKLFPHQLQKGCYVRWNKKALIDYNPDHFWATSKNPVKVKEIEIHYGGIWNGYKTIHFETPIEIDRFGETNKAFEVWIEHCCCQKQKSK